MSEASYRDALRSALWEEMKRDERVFIAGEEVGRYGGAYAVSKGLFQEFGDRRVVDTPISEAGIVGLGVGAAITGLRPVIELMYVDFVGLAMDQIGGTGRSAGAQHSQSLEAWLVHVPGLKVVMPATPEDAKGLLKTAIRSDDPVVFIEHKALYAKKGPVTEGEYTVPFGRAKVLRQGSQATLLSYSNMIYTVVEAADRLLERGIEAEVIDLRSLSPLDTETVLASVAKTGRAAVITEAHKTLGMSAELSALISERMFSSLKAPVLRIAAKDTPVPASILEKLSVPSVEEIVDGIQKLVSREKQ
jgi:pyruvate/2-oxoglutarate/acetoin dehydrogenase E1 component